MFNVSWYKSPNLEYIWILFLRKYIFDFVGIKDVRIVYMIFRCD